MESNLGFRSLSLTSPQAIECRRFATLSRDATELDSTGKVATATATRGTVCPCYRESQRDGMCRNGFTRGGAANRDTAQVASRNEKSPDNSGL